PDDIAMVVDHYNKRLAGEKVDTNYSFRIIHASGDVIWVELTAMLTSWKDHPATLNYINNITERKKAEDGLRESEELLRQIVKHDPLAIAVHDINMCYIAASDRWLRDYNVKES